MILRYWPSCTKPTPRLLPLKINSALPHILELQALVGRGTMETDNGVQGHLMVLPPGDRMAPEHGRRHGDTVPTDAAARSRPSGGGGSGAQNEAQRRADCLEERRREERREEPLAVREQQREDRREADSREDRRASEAPFQQMRARQAHPGRSPAEALS